MLVNIKSLTYIFIKKNVDTSKENIFHNLLNFT